MSRKLFSGIALAAALSGAVIPGHAQLSEWTGSNSDDWFIAGNWNPAGVPAAGTNVIINTTAPNTTAIDGAATASLDVIQVATTGSGLLDVFNGGTLINNGNAFIGTEDGSFGSVFIDGTNSEWTIGNNLAVGLRGLGVLNIRNGATVSNNNARIGNDATGSGAVTVNGSGWTVNGNLFVAHTGTGALDVRGGSLVTTSAQPFIGYQAGSDGSVLVRDGSGWTATGANGLFVGRSGQGQLSIESGAGVTVPSINLGVFSSGEGSVSVEGGALIANGSGEVRVGANGQGTLHILEGGTVSGSLGAIGDQATSTGEVTVSGVGATWINTSSVSVGFRGEGSLQIENGGTVSSAAGAIGSQAGSTGSAVVTGAGSIWSMTTSMWIGDDGIGSLNIAEGGTVSQGFAAIGGGPGGQGEVEVTGAGSEWNVSLVGVGVQGTGALHIGPGASVNTSDNVEVAQQPGSSGTVHVDGTVNTPPGNGVVINGNGSLAGEGEINGFVIIQDGGVLAPGSSPGTLDISGGLELRSGGSVLEFDLDTPGVVGGGVNDLIAVDGNLTLNGTLNVTDLGGFGNGVYTLITYTGTLIDNGLSIGSIPGGLPASIDTSVAGEVRLVVGVTGPFTWIGGVSDDWFTAGNWDPMAVPGVGDVVNLDNVVPNPTVIDGLLNANSGTIRVGASNQGELIVRNEAILNSTASSIAGFIGSTGSALVTFPGSRWDSSIILTVGASGSGSLQVENGGVVTAPTSSVGTNTGSVGMATVNGDDSQWLIGGSFLVGRFGSGTVRVENGALLESENASIGFGSSSSGLVTVDGAGSRWNNDDELVVGEEGNSGTLAIVDGGRVDNQGNAAIGGVAGFGGEVVLEGAGSVLNNGGSLFVGFEGSGLLEIGTDAVVNVGASTTIAAAPGSSGELRVNGTLNSDFGVIVQEGGLLGGDGSVVASIQVTGGEVAPGASPGTLDINGFLELDDASLLTFELDTPGVVGSGVNDLITVNGDLILDGTVDIIGLGGFGAGTYTLITYTGALNDNELVIGSLPVGFAGTINTATGGEVLLLVEATTAPVLSLAPATLDFGDVETGITGGPLAATLTNTGNADLVVSAVTLPASPFAADDTATSCTELPFTLTPGSSCDLAVAFSPTMAGPASQTLFIESNAASSPDSLELIGNGVEPSGAPALSVAPATLDFGDVEIGTTSAPLTTTISNTGDADLVVSSVTEPVAPFAGEDVGTTCAELPFTLTPGASCDLAVVFQPGMAGPAAQTLSIESNADSSPDSLELSGNGVTAPAPEALAIPTLNRPGLLLMIGLLLLFGLFAALRVGLATRAGLTK